MTCQNCAAECEGAYCWRCSQPTTTRPITLKRLLSDALLMVAELDDRGFLFTAWQLTTRPANAIRAYLDGKRVAYSPPHKYLFWVGAVVTYLTTRFQVYVGEFMHLASTTSNQTNFLNRFFAYADTSGTLVNIVSIPVFALFSWLLFRNRGDNYAEHVVLNAYITAQQLLFFIGILGFVAVLPAARNQLLIGYAVGTLLYNGWVFRHFFNVQTARQWVSVLVSLLLSYASQLGLNLLIFVLVDKATV